MNRIILHVVFHVWLLSLSVTFSGFIHLMACISGFFAFFLFIDE